MMEIDNRNKQNRAETVAYICAAFTVVGFFLSLMCRLGTWFVALQWIALVVCFVSSTMALRKKKNVWLRLVRYFSLGVILTLIGLFILLGLSFFGVFDKKNDLNEPFTVGKMAMQTVNSYSYTPDEITQMQGVWMRDSVIMDSCRLVDPCVGTEDPRVVSSQLQFVSSVMSEGILPEDTIFFHWGDNVHKIFNMRWRVVRGGRREMLITDYEIKNGNTIPVDFYGFDKFAN